MDKIKLSIDIHGVIDAKPSIFAIMSKLLCESGHEVHILTGGSWTKELEEELKSYGISWTHHFSVYDHLMDLEVPTKGEIKFPDGTIQKKFIDGYWDSVKAKYCKENNISLHIDDTLIYNDFFETPFARFWSHNGKSKSPKKDIRHLD
jgi:hypothetical protein